MKKAFIIISFVYLLAGCSLSSIQPIPKAEQTRETKISEAEHDAYYNNPQVTDDSTLQKPGQTVTDEKGEATLKAVKQLNQVYHIGDIEYTIREVKLLHYRPDYSLIDYFHPLTEEEEFDFIKISVDIKNLSIEKRNFAPIALFETNTGVKADWNQDMYLEHLNGVLEGKDSKRGSLGFIVNETKNQKIEWIKILTSDVYNEKQERLEEAQTIKINF
ncbi:hypothetical protein ABES02_09010 [Neobacillus pocheonensis]|uniref:hypothetical protein n=1 Tax=Neobacillus pocheonensis TaxID=363869 RepID=UPI003D267A43